MCCLISAEVSECLGRGSQEWAEAAVLGVCGSSPGFLLTGPRGTSGAVEPTEVPLAGFGGIWVKAALPLSLLGGSDETLVSSPTWRSGCWSRLFTHT